MLLRTDSLLFNDVQKWMAFRESKSHTLGARRTTTVAAAVTCESRYLHRALRECWKHIVCPLIFKCLSRCNHFFVWILTFVFDLFSVLSFSVCVCLFLYLAHTQAFDIKSCHKHTKRQTTKFDGNSILQTHSTQIHTHLFHFFTAVDNNLPEEIVQNSLANENILLQISGQFMDGDGVTFFVHLILL